MVDHVRNVLWGSLVSRCHVDEVLCTSVLLGCDDKLNELGIS